MTGNVVVRCKLEHNKDCCTCSEFRISRSGSYRVKQLQLEMLNKMLAQRPFFCNMTVDWTIAQLEMPMEAMVADPPSPPWFCMSTAIS